nr:MAG TPA: hypothetical protein [Caudoviricetes sp.]
MKRLLILSLFVFAAFNFANAQRKAGVSLRQIKDGETTSRGMLVMGAPGRDTLTVSFPRSWGPLNSAAPNSPMGNGEVSMYFVSADCGHGQIVDFERMWADSLNLENHIVFNGRAIALRRFTLPSGERVLAVDGIRNDDTIYYTMYYCIFEGRFVTASCIVAKKNNRDFQRAFEEYVHVFDAVFLSVKAERKPEWENYTSELVDLKGDSLTFVSDGKERFSVYPLSEVVVLREQDGDIVMYYVVKGDMQVSVLLSYAEEHGNYSVSEILEKRRDYYRQTYGSICPDLNVTHVRGQRGIDIIRTDVISIPAKNGMDGIETVIYELRKGKEVVIMALKCAEGSKASENIGFPESIIKGLRLSSEKEKEEEFSFDLDGKKCFSFTAPSKFNKRGYDEDTGKWFYVYLERGVDLALNYENGLFVDFSDTANVKKRCDFFKTGGPAIEASHKILPKGYHLFTISNLFAKDIEAVQYEIWKGDLCIRLFLRCMEGRKVADYESLMDDILNTFEIF